MVLVLNPVCQPSVTQLSAMILFQRSLGELPGSALQAGVHLMVPAYAWPMEHNDPKVPFTTSRIMNDSESFFFFKQCHAV